MACKQKNPPLRICVEIAIAILIAACLSGRAMAGAHEDANAADQRGDYVAELRILRPEAARGQAWAQNNLGNLYLNGNGVAEDDAQALAWFGKAAAQGDPGGEVNVGQMFEHGLGVPRNLTRAATLYREAGDQGRAGAWSMLKRLCDHKGVPASQCIGIPTGTQSAPDWDLHGKATLLARLAIKLLLAGTMVFVSVRRLRAALKAKKARAEMAASAGGKSGAVPQTRAPRVGRFLIVGNATATALVIVPLVVVVLSNPNETPWSPLMVLWDAAIIVGWLAIAFVYGRRVRKNQSAA